MGIEKFEDIDAWKRARVLANDIFGVTSQGGFAKDFSLSDQIRRAVVSVMANIAEGFGGQSNKEFIQFLNYAHRSALEVQSHLYVALDRGYIEQEQFNNIYEKTLTTKKLINGFIRYLKKEK